MILSLRLWTLARWSALGSVICGGAAALPQGTPPLLAAPPAAAVLPDTTRAYVATGDARRWQQQWNRTGLARVDHAAALQRWWDDVVPGQVDVAATGPSWLGFRWDDLAHLAGGELCLAVVEVSPRQAARTVIVDTAGRVDQTRQRLQALDASYIDRGATRSLLTIGQQKVLVYRLTGAEVQRGAAPERLYLYRAGVLIAADNRDLVRELLDRWSGEADDSLERSPAWRFVRETCRQSAGDGAGETDPADLEWFIDPPGYLSLLDAERSPRDRRSERWLESTGLAAIRAAGGRAILAAPPYDLRHELAVHAPGPRDKAARMLSFVALEQPPAIPAWIADDVESLLVVGWKYVAALEGYGSWFEMRYAEGEEGVFQDVLRELRDEPDAPGVDVRRELVDQLQGPLLAVTFPRRTADGDSESPHGTLLAARVAAPPRVAGAVRKMLVGDPDVRLQKIGAVDVWVFRDSPQSAGADDTAARSTLGPDLSRRAVCVAHDHLLVASDVETMSDLLQPRRTAGSLGDSPQFQRVVEHLRPLASTGAIAWQYARPGQDPRDLLAAWWTGRRARSEGYAAPADATRRATAEPPPAPNGGGAPHTPPALAELQAPWGPSGLVVLPVDGGWRLRQVTLAAQPDGGAAGLDTGSHAVPLAPDHPLQEDAGP